MARKPTFYRTDCSRCRENVLINMTDFTVTVHGAVQTVYTSDDGEMLVWDCPWCGYADSYWPDFYKEEV